MSVPRRMSRPGSAPKPSSVQIVPPTMREPAKAPHAPAHEDGAAAHAVAGAVAGVALDDDEAARHAELVAGAAGRRRGRRPSP